MLGLFSHLISAVTHLAGRFLSRFRSKEQQAAAKAKLLDRVKRMSLILNVKATHHKNADGAAQTAMTAGAALNHIKPGGIYAAAPDGRAANTSESGGKEVSFSSTHKSNKEVTEVDGKTGRKRRRRSRGGRNLSRRKGQSRQP